MAPQASKIERTRSYLMESSLHEDTKANLERLLDAAVEIEVSTDANDISRALAKAVNALVVHEVRQTIHTPDTIKGAINRHVEELHKQCVQIPKTKIEIFVFLLSKPWPWIAISVGVFSPHAVGIVEAISLLLGGK